MQTSSEGNTPLAPPACPLASKEVSEISLKLERDLFIKFWGWLCVVGSVVLVAGSVLGWQFAKTATIDAANAALKDLKSQVAQLENHTIASAGRIGEKMGEASVRASEAARHADEAQKVAKRAEGIIAASEAIAKSAANVDAISKSITENAGFQGLVVKALRERSMPKIVINSGSPTKCNAYYTGNGWEAAQATIECPDKTVRISGGCNLGCLGEYSHTISVPTANGWRCGIISRDSDRTFTPTALCQAID